MIAGFSLVPLYIGMHSVTAYYSCIRLHRQDRLRNPTGEQNSCQTRNRKPLMGDRCHPAHSAEGEQN